MTDFKLSYTEIIHYNGHTLHRIYYDWGTGGWAEKEDNLICANTRVLGDSKVYGTSQISSFACIDNSIVCNTTVEPFSDIRSSSIFSSKIGTHSSIQKSNLSYTSADSYSQIFESSMINSNIGKYAKIIGSKLIDERIDNYHQKINHNTLPEVYEEQLLVEDGEGPDNSRQYHLETILHLAKENNDPEYQKLRELHNCKAKLLHGMVQKKNNCPTVNIPTFSQIIDDPDYVPLEDIIDKYKNKNRFGYTEKSNNGGVHIQTSGADVVVDNSNYESDERTVQSQSVFVSVKNNDKIQKIIVKQKQVLNDSEILGFIKDDLKDYISEKKFWMIIAALLPIIGGCIYLTYKIICLLNW